MDNVHVLLNCLILGSGNGLPWLRWQVTIWNNVDRWVITPYICSILLNKLHFRCRLQNVSSVLQAPACKYLLITVLVVISMMGWFIADMLLRQSENNTHNTLVDNCWPENLSWLEKVRICYFHKYIQILNTCPEGQINHKSLALAHFMKLIIWPFRDEEATLSYYIS